MSEQTKTQPMAPVKSWETLVTKLLQLYAQEIHKLADATVFRRGTESSMDVEKFRADIRKAIIQVGKTMDETEKNYKDLIDAYAAITR